MVEESDIFVRGKFTDFEKLLFAEGQIKELKNQLKERDIEIGKLKSHVDELMNLQVSDKSFLGEKMSPELLEAAKLEIAKIVAINNIKTQYTSLRNKHTKIINQLIELGYEISNKGTVRKFDKPQ